MRVTVFFKSGKIVTYILPEDILAHKMFALFAAEGGPIQKIEFP